MRCGAGEDCPGSAVLEDRQVDHGDSDAVGQFGEGRAALLEQSGVLWPKLFRRLVEFHGETGRHLADFTHWLATEKPEQVVDLDDEANFTHLDSLVDVDGHRVRLTRAPHRVIVVSAKGRRAR